MPISCENSLVFYIYPPYKSFDENYSSWARNGSYYNPDDKNPICINRYMYM